VRRSPPSALATWVAVEVVCPVAGMACRAVVADACRVGAARPVEADRFRDVVLRCLVVIARAPGPTETGTVQVPERKFQGVWATRKACAGVRMGQFTENARPKTDEGQYPDEIDSTMVVALQTLFSACMP